ncbi:MAG: hypothetical protein M1133_09505 [Armatimonadetes bacterium]|nr:hypothetical protein [Armatimonadota bacterium]
MDNLGMDPRSEWTPERVALLGRNAFLVLVAAIVLGMFAVHANLYYVGAIVSAAVLTLMVVWQFEATLMIYALIAFIPWGKTPDLAVGGSGVGKGVFVSEIMLGYILMIWCGKYLFRVLPGNRPKSGFHTAIILYLVYSVLNLVNSFIFWDPHINREMQKPMANMAELMLRFLSAGAFVIFATSVTNTKWLKWITIAILTAGLYNTLNALAGSPIPIAAPWWPLITLLPAGYFCAVVLDSGKAIHWRILAGFAVVVMIVTIFFRNIGWVSGWLGLIPALAVVTYLKSRRFFAIVLVVVVLASAIAWPFLQKNVVEESKAGGDYDRFSLMRAGWRYATSFPLGVGLGNYRSYNIFYGEKWETTSYTSAHGTYSQHLSEMGIPGTILFLAILIGGCRWLLRSYRKMSPGFSRTFVLAAIGQIVGIAIAASVGDYIFPTYHNGGLCTFSATVYSWLIWGLAVAHVRIDTAKNEVLTVEEYVSC